MRVRGAKIMARIGDEPTAPTNPWRASMFRIDIATARVAVVKETLMSRIIFKIKV
jgi:hypothetical protein